MKSYLKKFLAFSIITITTINAKKTLSINKKIKLAFDLKQKLPKSQSNQNSQIKNTSQIESLTSEFINDIIVDSIENFLYLPFSHTLLEAILQSLRENKTIHKDIPLEIQKLINTLKKYCNNFITKINTQSINKNFFIVSQKNLETIKRNYPHSFNNNFLSKKKPFVLETSLANIQELNTIMHQNSTHPEIYKTIKSLITNKQLLPIDKNKNLFTIMPNIPKIFMKESNKKKNNITKNIIENDINEYGQTIFEFYTDKNMSLLNNIIEGYILIQIINFNKKTQKKILEFVTKHSQNKTKNKIKEIYQKIIESYNKNIVLLDRFIQYAHNIQNEDDAKTKKYDSLKNIIDHAIKIIFNNNEKIQNTEKLKQLKIAGTALAAATIIGGTIFYVNPTMAINGIKTIRNITKDIFQSSIIAPIKTLFNSNSDSITKKITQFAIFQPFHWAANSILSLFTNTHSKIFNTMISGERSFFKTIASNLAMTYITKKIMNATLEKTGITNEKSNLNILSKIKKKVIEAAIGQKIYYLFDLPIIFSTVLESRRELYKLEKPILDMPQTLPNLIEKRIKENEAVSEMGKLYNTLEELTLQHLTSN